MRLINTSTLELEDFVADTVPWGQYSILSHRWEKNEFSLQMMTDSNYTNSTQRDSEGYQKIKQFCEVSASKGYQWAWMDTCCIDRSSSAELSEAVNSMYTWYENAGVCLVYMSDVEQDSKTGFEKSQWFKRGWTLQELIAPSSVLFYDHDWRYLGEKQSLSTSLSHITGIPVPILMHPRLFKPKQCSVAQRMSWVSMRTTAREEDLAYCLMGLFQVHIPLLYGEGGANAFYRLQLEIMATSDDESIFAWDRGKGGASSQGMLSTTPHAFWNLGRMRMSPPVWKRKPYSMTNRGLQMELDLYSSARWEQFFVAPLNCHLAGKTAWLKIFPIYKHSHGTLSAMVNPRDADSQKDYESYYCAELFYQSSDLVKAKFQQHKRRDVFLREQPTHTIKKSQHTPTVVKTSLQMYEVANEAISELLIRPAAELPATVDDAALETLGSIASLDPHQLSDNDGMLKMIAQKLSAISPALRDLGVSRDHLAQIWSLAK